MIDDSKIIWYGDVGVIRSEFYQQPRTKEEIINHIFSPEKIEQNRQVCRRILDVIAPFH